MRRSSKPRLVTVPDQASRKGQLATRFTWWRLRSRACAVVDMLCAAAAAVLYVVSLVDSVVSWPSDRALVTDARIGPPVAVIGFFVGLWWVVSGVMVFGFARGRRVARPVDLPPPSRRRRLALALVVAIAVAVVTGNALLGIDKGEARTLPGPRYQVSTSDLNDDAWTTVSAGEYRTWQARFIRGDCIVFAAFGIIFFVCELGLLRMHRTVTCTHGES